MRLLDGVILALAVGGAAYVYDLKHDAEQKRDERSELARGVEALATDVALLEADLAALESPQRLQRISNQLSRRFALDSVSSGHYVALTDIPFRGAATEGSSGEETTASVPAPTLHDGEPLTNGGAIADFLSGLSAADEGVVRAQPLPAPLSEEQTSISAPSSIDDLLERLP